MLIGREVSQTPRECDPLGVLFHATAGLAEATATGSRATMSVPLSFEWMSKLPPSCRSLSRMPRIPTPGGARRGHLKLLFWRYALATILDFYANMTVSGGVCRLLPMILCVSAPDLR